jgi:hypothetical protein
MRKLILSIAFFLLSPCVALGQAILVETSTPSGTPPSNYEYIYTKAGAGVCAKLHSGIEICGATGSGTVNSASQYSLAYYPSTGTAVSGVNSPGTIGHFFWGNLNPTAEANAPQPLQIGTTAREVTTSPDTITTADCAFGTINYKTAASIAVTLGTPASLSNTGCAFTVASTFDGTNTPPAVTITAGGSYKFSINGGALATTLTIASGQWAFVYPDQTETAQWDVFYSAITTIATPAGVDFLTITNAASCGTSPCGTSSIVNISAAGKDNQIGITVQGKDASLNGILGSTIVRGSDQTGTGGSNSQAGGILLRAGQNASTSGSSQAGGTELESGYSTSGGVQGSLTIGQYYTQGPGSVTQWNVECQDSAATTADDCPASPTSYLGVGDAHTGSAVEIHTPPGQSPVNASAAVTLGHTVCLGAASPAVTDSAGTGGCSTGLTFGKVVRVSGLWTGGDGDSASLSTTLPLVQMFGKTVQIGSGDLPATISTSTTGNAATATTVSGGVYLDANTFAGADWGIKLAACIAALPAAGGTCDTTRSSSGTTSTAALSTLTVPVTVIFGAATYATSADWIPTASNATEQPAPPLNLIGAGADWSNKKGTLINWTASSGTAHLQLLGHGEVNIEGIAFQDLAGTEPFILDINGQADIWRNAFIGSATGSNATNDAIILGGTTGVPGGGCSTVTCPFQGHKTFIIANTGVNIGHLVLFQSWANDVKVIANYVSSGGGVTAPIELNGAEEVGNQITDNGFEMANYTYGIWCHAGCAQNTFTATSIYDPGVSTVAAVRFESAQIKNGVFGGDDAAKGLCSDANVISNAAIGNICVDPNGTTVSTFGNNNGAKVAGAWWAQTLAQYPAWGIQQASTGSKWYAAPSDAANGVTINYPLQFSPSNGTAAKTFSTTPTNGGSNYVQGDVGTTVTLACGATTTITQVNSGSGTGPVTTIAAAATGYGTGCATGTGQATTGGTGTGLTVNVTALWGVSNLINFTRQPATGFTTTTFGDTGDTGEVNINAAGYRYLRAAGLYLYLGGNGATNPIAVDNLNMYNNGYYRGVQFEASGAAASYAGGISYGGTTAAASNCGSLTGAAGCIVVNIAGTTHYVPYW